MATPVVVVDEAGPQDTHVSLYTSICSDALCRALSLDTAPPYVFVLYGMAHTSLIHASLFGPRRLRSKQAFGLERTLLLAWTLASFLLQLLVDANTMLRVFLAGEPSLTEKSFAIVVVIGLSPNTAAGIAMSALGSVYEQAKAWRQDRDRGGLNWPSFSEALSAKGPMCAAYGLWSHYLGAIPGAIAFVFCVPAFCAYCWIFIPIGSILLCVSYCCYPFLIRIAIGRRLHSPVVADTSRGDEQESLPSARPETEPDPDDEEGDGQSAPFWGETREDDVDWLFVTTTGAPPKSWVTFSFAVLELFLLALCAPMAVHLYNGVGYMPAFASPFLERNSVSWLRSVFMVAPGGPESIASAFVALNWLT
eukprot:TRINITY_DN21906_c0_g1_i2.p1 TRINITY_DN21906_c0_g1~~TRINITY_DN21906_c0_g1_i2.p1  ORF type:complete len:364 (+),score=22.02 TRINITY_DN21906_c0_g1_i2:48-1139(+)